MYLKLGNTYVKYENKVNNFNIVSEIVDSKISYEIPRLITSIDELDIWFGKDFSNRDYYVELLSSGITLYLYRPISEISYINENYINYESFEIKQFNNIEDLPTEGESNILYKVFEKDGIYIENNNKYNKYIWYISEYVNIQYLPQNSGENNSISILNRDTLKLNYVGYEGPEYSYPKYNGTDLVYDYEEIINSSSSEKDCLLNNYPDLEKINNQYETLSFNLKFDEDISNLSSNDGIAKYIILSDVNISSENLGKNVLIWFKDSSNIQPKIDSKYFYKEIFIDIKDKTIEDLIEEFINILIELGYKIIKKTLLEFSIYSFYKLKCSYFYNIPNFSMNDNFEITNNLLTGITKDDTRIEFISKLIGKDNKENIKVKIEELTEEDNYRITISKYDYSEVFEGNLTNNRIDFNINNNSKLIKCNLKLYYTENNETFNYLTGFRNKNLPIGEWELRRGDVENYDQNMYWRSLDIVFKNNEFPFDYFLVPNIHNYVVKLDNDYNYYKEYLNLLDYSKIINCQILIQNSDTKWDFEYVNDIPQSPKENIVYVIVQNDYKIYMAIIDGVFQETTDREIINEYKNDFIFNYTEDKENRLIYFYRPISVSGSIRPGYYLFLKSILVNDVYLSSSSSISYNSPIKNPYEDDKESIEVLLKKYKSNYLVYNNYMYYYKEYQNGKNYDTSIWMRFCLSKISRELEKNKWSYISYRTINEIISSIKSTLNNIKSNFSIIRDINISDYSVDFNKQLINLTIDTYISDLIKNNISIDITLNYNN